VPSHAGDAAQLIYPAADKTRQNADFANLALGSEAEYPDQTW
jgi:hypothetical protein